MSNLQDLLNYQKNISDIQYTINLLRWDLKVNTPKKSEKDLIDVITNYENRLFELQTSDYYGNLLKSAIDSEEFKKLDIAEERYIHNLLRHFEEFKRIPSDFYSKYVETKSISNIAWKNAQEKNDYNLFKPYLNQVIELTKKYYKYIDNNSNNLYDAMLNHYETGIDSSTINNLFNGLKEKLIPIIKIMSKNESSQKKYYSSVEYTDQELFDCAKFLLEYIGFDMEKGTLGIYPHAFTQKMNANDIRIAFEHTKNPFKFVTTIIHEGGHGIFEQNIDKKLSRYENTIIENLHALHESQSRFYENILGRNKNFWIPIYDEIRKKLHLNISLDEFVEELNCFTPNPIRLKADELTYCMHIILRYEIEKAIFNNEISIDDIPNIWNKKIKEYLGVEVKNDSEGLMQDVHWSDGHFGYFPSYLLGTIYDGMLIESIEKNVGNINELLKSGNIKKITNYLINNIYKNGGAFTSKEVINKICGSDISIIPIVDYYEKKYYK